MERRAITAIELAALHSFLKLEISFEQLITDLHDMIQLEFLPAERRFTSHFLDVGSTVLVVREDITNALSKFRSGECPESDLIRWATMLLLNDIYVWDNSNEQQANAIVDALQELSTGGIKAYEAMNAAKRE